MSKGNGDNKFLYSFKKYIFRVATGKPTFNFQPWNIQSDDTDTQLNVSNMHSQPNLQPTFSQDSDKAGGQTSLGSTSRLIPRTTSTQAKGQKTVITLRRKRIEILNHGIWGIYLLQNSR